MAKFVGTIAGGKRFDLRGPTRQDAEDELRMELGALWKDDWKSRYGVRIRRVPDTSDEKPCVDNNTPGFLTCWDPTQLKQG